MSAKKFLAIVTVASTLLFLLICTLLYYIDPLYYYRKTNLYRPQYNATERYQMAGLVKTQEYNTLITATSMGRNFIEPSVNKKLKTKSFNGSLPASTAHEQSMVAELALSQNKELDNIIWELNFYSFSSYDPKWVMGPPSDFPKYMYDDSKLNDVKYLFNSYTVDVLYRNLLANRKGEEGFRDVYSLYKFYNVAPPESINRVQQSLVNVPQAPEVPAFERAQPMIDSFKYNVIQLAEMYPNTKFTLFFAPYPVYNHVTSYRSNANYLSERLKFKEEVYNLVSQHKNIELYDFQDEAQITFNINNYYSDAVHYYEFINNWIIDYMAENPPIQSEDEYKQKLKRWEEQIINFDTNQLQANDSIKNSINNE